MNFKKIEVCGFKSFADKTVIEFNDGITGIVGPNGCGKSNVADAIRWVLGEQSPKLLRGKSMQDVIFKGTTRRSELSVCEVILTFDNSKKIFPNLEYEEVSIGRKLYKSSESEYLINGEICRLKDVQDLIRDTGLGREGYSIVGQGRVDEIVNAKPKDRRGIFEDAAGVLKFKMRKQDAMRKLERAKENIGRLDDILNEIRRQLTPLEKQSEDAKKFLQIRDELRSLEVNEYIYKYENNDQARNLLIERLKEIESDFDKKSAEYDNATANYADKNSELNYIDIKVGKLRDQQTSMAVNAESIKGQGSTLNERISLLKEQKITFGNQLVELEGQLDEKANILCDFQNKNAMQKEDREEASRDYNELSHKLVDVADDILKREQQIEQKNIEMHQALVEIGDIKADVGKLVTKRENCIARKEELQNEIAKFKASIDIDEEQKVELDSDVAKLKDEKIKLANSKNQIQYELNNLKASVDINRDECSKINGSISAFESKYKTLQSIKNDYESFSGAVKNLMQTAKQNPAIGQRALGVVSDLIKSPKEYEVSIETALGNNIQNVVTRNEDDAKFLIEFLKQNKFGRITFLPLTSFKAKELDDNLRGALKEKGCLGVASKLITYDPKFANIISGLLGRTLVCEDMDCAIAMSKKYSYNLKIVTLQGEVINPSGSITGGSRRSEGSNVLSQERQIEDTKILLDKASEKFALMQKKIKDDLQELDEMSLQLREYEENVKLAEVSYATHVGKLDKVLSRLNQSLDELKARNLLVSDIDMSLQAIQSALDQISDKDESVKGLANTVDSATSKKKAEFDEKKAQREALSELVTNAQVRLSTIETEIVNSNESIDRYQREVDLIANQIASCKRSIKNTEDKIYNAENNLNTVVVTDEDKQKYAELVEEIASLDDYKKRLNQAIGQLVELKDEITKQRQTIAEQKVKQQSQIEKLDGVMVSMQTHIEEEYELNYLSCLPYKLDDFNLSNVAGQISKLRKAKYALGGVNVEAIEQFKEQSARFAEMSEQREDLVNTANDCLSIIDEMSKEMKVRFESAFEIINRNFQAVFKELFGGGEGKLIIEKPEEGEDPLDAGIEIYAMPPGKSLKSITLFSGGEKALIAIAILFAILRMKAMPFCVLDEIEAALDDSNVGLFAKYLGRFSRETQFIVITHRKPTMELADRLYGVTMQEKGVSKVVTVSLTEATEQL